MLSRTSGQQGGKVLKKAKNKTEYLLVGKAKKGDRESLNKLCQLRAQSILFACLSLVGDMHDAEDLSQNVILRVCTSLNKLDKPSSFDAWLYRVIHNEFLNFLRQKNPGEEFDMEYALEQETEIKREYLPEHYLEDNENKKLLQELLDELPVTNRYCLVMFYFEEMSYREIAQVLEITEKDVKNMLYRSKLRMRAILKDKDETTAANYALILSPAMLGTYMKQKAGSLSIKALTPTLEMAISQLPAQAATSAVSAKIAPAVVSATMIAVGATAGVSIMNEKPPQVILSSISQTAVSTSELPETTISGNAETPIDSLEDLIGAENAALLLQYTASPPSYSELQEFLHSTGLSLAYKSDDQGTHYILYALEKQDKRLMVIIKQTNGNDVQGLVYDFSTQQNPIPSYYEVVQSYYNW